MLFVLIALLAVLTAPGPESAPTMTEINRWAEPTRAILTARCGSCHLPTPEKSVPRALAVFDLSQERWYGRLTRGQLDSLARRIRSNPDVADSDRAIVESFVRCARDRDCPGVDR